MLYFFENLYYNSYCVGSISDKKHCLLKKPP